MLLFAKLASFSSPNKSNAVGSLILLSPSALDQSQARAQGENTIGNM